MGSFSYNLLLINRMSTPVLNNLSLFQKLYNQLPDYPFFKVFSCSYFPFLKPYNHHKLDFHTKKYIFIDYSPLHKGYKCLDLSGKVFVTRHVSINETKFPYKELFLKQSTLNVSNIDISSSSVQFSFL